MESGFNIRPSKYFLKQLSQLSSKELNLVEDKLQILKQNPFRYKKLEGYKNTFEVKITINKNYSRLIYSVYIPHKNEITVYGIFKRKNNFKDFRRYYDNN